MKDELSLAFTAHVSKVMTSMGTWKLQLDLFEADLVTAAKLPAFYQKSVSVALVLLPEE